MFVHSHMHTDRDDNVPLKLLKIQNAESERRGNEKKLNFNSTIWRNIENTKVDDNKGRKTHRRNKRTSKIVWELRAHNNQKKLFNMKKQRHTKHKKPNEQPDRFSISLLIFFSVRSLCVPTNFCSLHLLNFFVFFFCCWCFYYFCLLCPFAALSFRRLDCFFLALFCSLSCSCVNFRRARYLWPVWIFPFFGFCVSCCCARCALIA